MASKSDTLTVTDNRTGQTYEIPISDGAIPAIDLRQIKVTDDDFGLLSYDPAFQNTATCHSEITYIDGDRGILEYRGYPIQDLAESCSYLEVAYLLLFGKLPDRSELDSWVAEVNEHTLVPENLKRLIEGFWHDAHPMGMLVSTVAAYSTFHAEARNVTDPVVRRRQIPRLIGGVPTLAAFAHRRTIGLPYVYPDDELSYTGNLLAMTFRHNESRYVPNPVLERALDALFILHADHEQNCSTNAMRSVGSSHSDPYSATAAAAAALYGPLHGGANEATLRMLQAIGARSAVPDFIKRVKQGETRLSGFGHRIYKSYDPRATIIKRLAHEVFAVTGTNPLLEIALELERIALEDDYFISRKLYPNVDFYSGLIYQSMGFPVGMFPVLFAIPRTSGWLAQWEESLEDREQKIARPRQLYAGEKTRDVVPLADR